jgi:hypothetical protein
MADDSEYMRLSWRVCDEVDTEAVEPGGESAPWLRAWTWSEPGDGRMEVAVFGSATAARRLADGVAAWADAAEAWEAKRRREGDR